MLSIGKLAYLTQVQEIDSTVDERTLDCMSAIFTLIVPED